ncbi:MAG TPA: primosomal protein N' [Casimicrobiaceae bacterium]|nr:primosomal protein N' [Casimicrobiaceae bacterium]
MTIARVALPVAVDKLFDYWVPAGLDVAPGAVVRVRLGRRNVAGVVHEVAQHSDVPRADLQAIDEVVDVPPLPGDVRDLVAFVAAYYQAPLGLAYGLAAPPLVGPAPGRGRAEAALRLTVAGREALAGALARAPAQRALHARLAAAGAVLAPDDVRSLSPGLRRVLGAWRARGWVEDVRVDTAGIAPRLNDEQRAAVDAILAARGAFAPLLLQGVTGSGKTEVYLACAEAIIAGGGQVLMLVPEINLTPQLTARVAEALPNARTATLHSGLAEGVRRAHWEAAARGEADIVLGTRLAVFAPLPRLALVVVDEEHDASFKQHEGVRYHARDAAVWRARRRATPVVLGSATPSLESEAHARAGRYRRLTLARRADPRATFPVVRLVPARGPDVREGLSAALLAAIGERLARGEQSLVFVNRRGFAPSLKCPSCGWEAGCPRCSARLTTHRTPPRLLCHHCGHRERVPHACPSCGNVDLAAGGHGTQRLEAALQQAFPQARIARVDRDSTRRAGSFAAVRDKVRENVLDILIGTQMLAKGHDFPRLTLVGVLGADNALYSADFRATERAAALLLQVAGRAGRAERPGEVIVQTDFPGHPLFAAVVRHDYDALAQETLAEREAAELPPFAHLALVAAEAHRREDVERFLDDAHRIAVDAARRLGADVEVFPPVAAALARRAGFERSQMLLRSRQRAPLKDVVTALRAALADAGHRRVRHAIDVDPQSLA